MLQCIDHPVSGEPELAIAALLHLPSRSFAAIHDVIHDDMLANEQQDLKAALELISTGEFRRAENINQLELAAWTGVANVLLNLDETITKE